MNSILSVGRCSGLTRGNGTTVVLAQAKQAGLLWPVTSEWFDRSLGCSHVKRPPLGKLKQPPLAHTYTTILLLFGGPDFAGVVTRIRPYEFLLPKLYPGLHCPGMTGLTTSDE